MTLRQFQPPHTPPAVREPGRIRLFVGGSIEMGRAQDWQNPLIKHLQSLPEAPRLDVFNPRRHDWNPEWPNNYDFAPFREQVDWELVWQKQADILVYYLASDTISPITLLEIGLFNGARPVIGIGPNYSRAGNIWVTRDHFPMDVYDTWDGFLAATSRKIRDFGVANPVPGPRALSPG